MLEIVLSQYPRFYSVALPRVGRVLDKLLKCLQAFSPSIVLKQDERIDLKVV